MDAYSKYEHLTFERNEGVLTVRISRAPARNAVHGALHTELSWLFSDIREDAKTRAVVLTGEGAAFSAGGDLNWMAEMTAEDVDAVFREARKIIIDLLELPQPIVAAVNGPAVGLGATLALLCDVVFAADNAVLGDPHVVVGVVAGDGGAVIWPWLVGVARAKEYLMTGDLVPALEAERIGLVNHVVAADELLERAHALATRLAGGPVKAIQGTKASVNKILRDTANLVLDTSIALEKECFSTAEFRESIERLRRPKTRPAGVVGGSR